MLNIGPQELILVLIVALVVVGPRGCPSSGRSIGKALREFRKVQDDVKDTIKLRPRRRARAVRPPEDDATHTDDRPHARGGRRRQRRGAPGPHGSGDRPDGDSRRIGSARTAERTNGLAVPRRRRIAECRPRASSRGVAGTRPAHDVFSKFRRRPPEQRAGTMTLVEHLEELRHRLIVCIVAVACGAVVGWFLYGPVLDLVLNPYCDYWETIASEAPDQRDVLAVLPEPLGAMIVSSRSWCSSAWWWRCPVLLYQLWSFIVPG